jgi:hypothetical protein
MTLMAIHEVVRKKGRKDECGKGVVGRDQERRGEGEKERGKFEEYDGR